jgi:hypothetical protein
MHNFVINSTNIKLCLLFGPVIFCNVKSCQKGENLTLHDNKGRQFNEYFVINQYITSLILMDDFCCIFLAFKHILNFKFSLFVYRQLNFTTSFHQMDGF